MHALLSSGPCGRTALSQRFKAHPYVLKIAIFSLGALCAAYALLHGFNLFINSSDSLPKGIYRVTTGQSIQKGDLVLACLKEEDAKLAFKRGYIGLGSCPSHHAGIGKYVAAAEGDWVELNETGTRVNEIPVPLSKAARADGHGQDLPNINLKVRLSADEFVLINPAANSFDSRYLGLFDRSQVQGHLTPLLTFD